MMTDALEAIDILDPYTCKKTGESRSREEVYKNGNWHGVFHVWFVNKEKNALWVQKRSKNKMTGKGLLDVTVGGTLRKGETVKDGLREIEEELGFSVGYHQLNFMGKRYQCLKDETYFNNQIAYVYLYRSQFDLLNIHFNSDEVDGLFEIPFKNLHTVFRDPSYEFYADGIVFRSGKYQKNNMLIKKDSFVFSIDDYPCQVARYADWCFLKEIL